MDEYQIHFNLLVPRWLLFRLDVFPFLLVYSALFYGFYYLEDTGNTYIYLRLSLIAIAFLNCTFILTAGLTYIFGHWSKKIQAKIQFKKLKGKLGDNLLKASHVFVS